MNVQAVEELKRVLRSVDESEFNLNDWDRCACAHATRDAWFRQHGFTSCRDFYEAAAFFAIPRWKAEELFSAQYRRVVTPAAVIEQIDAMLSAGQPAPQLQAAHRARQVIIDDLLAKANRAARKTRRIAATVIAMFC